MFQVSGRQQQRIVEGGACQIKRYIVFGEVRRCLRFIPFKFKLSLRQSSFSRTGALPLQAKRLSFKFDLEKHTAKPSQAIVANARST